MKGITRRNFLKYCIGSAAVLGLDATVLGKLQQAMAQDAGALPAVIWLNGANCTGCTISLANRVGEESPTDITDLLINYIDLAFHPNLMGAAGDLAVQRLNEVASGDFILVMDGGVPTAFGGHTCMLWTENGQEVTALDAVTGLASKAAAVVCVGTCASFGGIPAAGPNPTGIQPVSAVVDVATVNIPGCPTHPDWIVWTVAQLLAGVVPEMDEFSRPRYLFDRKVHDLCPRRGMEEVDFFGQEGCLKELGCKGPKTKADCAVRQWNNGTNWCIGANAICIGCTEKDFPDKGFTPFYKDKGVRRSELDGRPRPEQVVNSDSVKIQKVTYLKRSRQLRVFATSSSQPDAQLLVVGYGAMIYRPNLNPPQYTSAFTNVDPPVSVTVQSSLGGTATATMDDHDEVTILKANYIGKTRQLRVFATSSSQPDAQLMVVGYGAMIYRPNLNPPQYTSAFLDVDLPTSVTIQSSKGGSATTIKIK